MESGDISEWIRVNACAIYCRALPLAANGCDDYGRAPAASGAHDFTVRREAIKSPLNQCVAMRFG
eukprot:3465952-Pleurochrysis_carterae.AAC.1